MQCNALDSESCGGALCFAAEDDDVLGPGARTFSYDSDGSGTFDDNEQKPKLVVQQKLAFGPIVISETYEITDDTFIEDEEDEERSYHFCECGATEAAAENFDDKTGKEVVCDNDDDTDDEGTVDTALNITQDVYVSASEDDDDLEPADVKIDLDNDNNDIDDGGEFAPKKDTNKTEDCSEENDRHTFIQVAAEKEEILTPQQKEWNDKYASLLKYYNKYGTSTIPLKVNTKPKHLLLRRWAEKQRLAFLNDELDPSQIQKLVAIDFAFGQQVEELVAEKIEQERIEAEQKAEAIRIEEEAKAAAVRAEEKHLHKLRKRMNHKKQVEQMRSEAISVVVGN